MRADDIAGEISIALGPPLSGVSFHHEVLALNVAKATQLLEKKSGRIRWPLTLMSPILVAGQTIAMRFIFDDCCAPAASCNAAAPPMRPMNSRRRM